MKSIIILGAGGFAREAYFHLLDGQYREFIFVDDSSGKTEVFLGQKRFDIVTNWNFSTFDTNQFMIGIGSPKYKRAMASKAAESGLLPAPTFVHSRALVQDAEIGVGGIITPGCIVTTNVKIGNFVLLNLNCTVGHDSVIGNYVTANPGCHISGNTKISDSVVLGTGTAVREGVTIADSIVTGAQAAVVANLDQLGTYVGVPAKPIVRS